MRKLLLLLLLLTAIAVSTAAMAPAVASAATTVTFTGGHLTITGDAEDDLIVLRCGGGNLTINEAPFVPSIECALISGISIDSGPGNDTVDLDFSPTDLPFVASAAPFFVDGGADNDILTAPAFPTFLDGAVGSDILNGSSAPTAFSPAPGNDIVNAVGVADLLTLENAGGGVTIDLAVTGTPQPLPGGSIVLNGIVEQFVGTPFNDVVFGNDVVNVYLGLGGDDSVDLRAANDHYEHLTGFGVDSGTLTINDGAGIDTATLTGASSGDAFTFGGGIARLNGLTINPNGVESFGFFGENGPDTFEVIWNSFPGALTIDGGGGPDSLSFACDGVTISAGSATKGSFTFTWDGVEGVPTCSPDETGGGGGTGGGAGPAIASVTIKEGQGARVTEVVEGDHGTRSFNVEVTLAEPATEDVLLDVQIAGGTAALGSDYGLPSEFADVSTVVLIRAGQRVGESAVLFQVVGDTNPESDETIDVAVRNRGVTIATQTFTILDDDPAPTVSISDASAVEGNEGHTSMVFTVTLSQPSRFRETVNVTSRDLSARNAWLQGNANQTAPLPDADYELLPHTTVVFEPGETSKTVTVDVIGDRNFEPIEERFALDLSSGRLPIGDGEGIGTIFDDDGPVFTPNRIIDTPGCHANELPRNDDGSTAAAPIGFTLNFFGNSYDHLFVNNNGNVTFEGPLPTYVPFQLTADTPPIIAAFLSDVDTRAFRSGVVTYGQTMHNGMPAFCVIWPNVGYFSHGTDRLNSFQLLLVSRPDTGPGNFDIKLIYDRIQWDLGGAGIGYSSGTGDESSFLELPGSRMSGAFLDSNPFTGLTGNGRDSLEDGVHNFGVRNGAAPVGGNLSGRITSGGTAVVGASVQACRDAGRCYSRFTNGAGRYSFTGIPGGEYDVNVFPPAGSSLFSTSGEANVPAPGAAELDLTLRGSTPPPPGTSFGTSAPGSVPVVVVGRPARLQTSGCDGGAATFVITGQYGGTFSGTLAEVAPGVYESDVAIPFTGPAQTRITIAGCPDVEFNIYIDPSGFVRTTSGAPIVGATVTLYRSDDPAGPFTVVPDGSAIMSPSNRTNPDTTDSTGHFGWDVIAGYYTVVAAKTGCTSAETAVMTIPPPVTNLDIRLDCGSSSVPTPSSGGSNGGGGGGGGGAPSTIPPTVTPTVTPPTSVPNAAPKLNRVGGSAQPLRARRGTVATVAAAFAIDEAAALSLDVRDVRTGRRVGILRGSRVAGFATGVRKFTIPFGVDAARTVQVALRFAKQHIRPGRQYRIVVTAVDREGARSTLVIAFRG